MGVTQPGGGGGANRWAHEGSEAQKGGPGQPCLGEEEWYW